MKERNSTFDTVKPQHATSVTFVVANEPIDSNLLNGLLNLHKEFFF